MGHLGTIDIVGFWLGIFLTFCVLSFLYKDNPFYKLAEHLFIGVSIGYVVTKQYYDVVEPKLVDKLADGRWVYLVSLVLGVMLLAKAVSRRWAWLGRYPIAFVVAYYAGLQINGAAQGDFGPQMVAGMRSVIVDKIDINTAPAAEIALLPGMSPGVTTMIVDRRAQRPFASFDELVEMDGITDGQRLDINEARAGVLGGAVSGLEAQASIGRGGLNWFGTFSQLLMLAGLLASLVYFYFSIEHNGAVGKVSRFGVWILMLGFGAAFGATVQGRLSLAIGRALDVLGRDKDPSLAAQIDGGVVALISIAVIVAGLVVWERAGRRRAAAEGTPE